MDNPVGNELNYDNFKYHLKGGDFFMPRRKNLIGEHFGDFIVIEMLWNYENKHRTYCKCIGIDNKEYIIRQDALISGATKTIHGACSAGIQHDITGKRFGRLVVIEPIEERASNGGIRWKCQCDCGKIIYPTMNNLIRRHTTSCGCAKKDYIESTKIDIIGKRFGKLTVIKEVESDKKRRVVLCQCDCGNVHVCTVSDLTIGHTWSCGCLNKSKGEFYIEQILKDNNINYITQKRFSDCKNIKPLPFDFYLPDYNCCIEYDGKQHYESVDYYGGEEKFLTRQKNDSIKNNYCKINNIKLIRIPYTLSNSEIFKIITNLISPATITA